MTQDELTVEVASDKHLIYVDEILKTIEEAAKVRGTGIAKRKPEYVAQKIKEAKAVIALQGEKFAGFSYIETWEHKQYVTTSGLIVHPDFRGLGLAKRIKDLTFSLARTRWPHAKIFSLTSGAAVMTMNTQLGYKPVTFAELTSDEAFGEAAMGASMWMCSSAPTENIASARECYSIRRSIFRRKSRRKSSKGSAGSTRPRMTTKINEYGKEESSGRLQRRSGHILHGDVPGQGKGL